MCDHTERRPRSQGRKLYNSILWHIIGSVIDTLIAHQMAVGCKAPNILNILWAWCNIFVGLCHIAAIVMLVQTFGGRTGQQLLEWRAAETTPVLVRGVGGGGGYIMDPGITPA
jgi:hypothetical protein